MFNLKDAPGLVLAALVTASIPIISVSQVQAQSVSPDGPLAPDSVATGTKVWIDGDPSLQPATQSFSDRFEEQYPNASIHYESQGSDAAVNGVITGRLDVAAIGRDLTLLEEQAGVETLALPREKIATFVGVDNDFSGEISDQQFAQIFRGEITNWSELGGADQPLRFIDLAATSDTRRSLGSYDLFQTDPFESGETAIIQPNNINTVIENLGNDGIGYALFEQVKDRPDIRILPMHGVMPTDVRYPFSQPRNFAYLGSNPTPEAIAFIDHARETTSPAPFSPGAGPQDWNLGRNAKALGASQGLLDNAAAQGTVAGSTLAAGSQAAGSQAASATAASSQAVGQANGANGISYRPGIMDTIHAPWWWLAPLAPLGVIGFAALRRKRLNAASSQGEQAQSARSQGTEATASYANAIGNPLTGAGLRDLGLGKAGLAGAGVAGAGLAAGGLSNRKAKTDPTGTTQWGRNNLANGSIANDDAASFALGNPPAQTPHKQTVNEIDFRQNTQAPSAPAEQVKAAPSLQPNEPLDRPVQARFNGKTVAAEGDLNGLPSPQIDPSASAPTNVNNVTFPNPTAAPEAKPGFGAIAGAGFAAAGLAGASLAAGQSKEKASSSPEEISAKISGKASADSSADQAESNWIVPSQPDQNPDENTLAAEQPADSRQGFVGDDVMSGDRSLQELSSPLEAQDNIRHLSERRRRELVDHSIDKALERPNGGKKAMPAESQSAQDLGQYGNPKPDHLQSEPAALGDASEPRSFDNSAAARQQNKLSSEDSTALGNALKRAGLGAADMGAADMGAAGMGAAGAAGMANQLSSTDSQALAPPIDVNPVAEAPAEPAPSSRLNAPMAGPGNSDNEETWITLTPHNSHQGEVNWHLSEEHRLQAKRQGGQRMMIRIHDADPSTQPEQWLASSYTYECRNSMDRKQVDFPAANRDYVAELGFLTAEEDWIHIARSVHSHSPTAEYDGCRIVIMPCDPHRQMRGGPTRNPKPQAYVYWDIAPEFKRRLRKQGGQMLALRIYDADHINLDHQAAHHTDEYMLDETARDKVVMVPIAEHDYVAEIGYLTIDGDFLSLGRSVFAHIPVAVS